LAGYVAWSRIKTASQGAGSDTDTFINTGDPVTQSDVGVDDEGWAQLVADGAVVEEVPDDIGSDESLNQYKTRTLLAELAVANEPARVGESVTPQEIKDSGGASQPKAKSTSA